MELLGIILIYIISPLETFFKLGNFGTISKLLGYAILFIFVLRILIRKKISIPRESYFLMAFIVLGLASALWAYYPNTALGRSFTLIQLFLLYTITFNMFKNNNSKLARNFYKIIIFFGAALSLYIVFQVIISSSITQWSRISISDQVDVNHLASFLIPSFLFGLYYSINKTEKYLIPTMTVLVAILLTQSRGAFVSISIPIVIYLLIIFKTIKKQGLKYKQVFLAVAGLCIVFIIIPKEFLYRINLMLQSKEILLRGSGRNVIWGNAWNEFTNSPIVGIGLGNFTALYRPPHSSLFQILSELGIIGVFVMALFLVMLFFDHRRKKINGIDFEFIVAIALLLMSLTVDIFYQKYLWIMIGVCSSVKYSKIVSSYNEKEAESLTNQ